MSIDKLLTELQQAGIILSVADSGDSLTVQSAPGAMTDDLRIVIRENKQDLIKAVCHKVVVYEREQLYGQMPKCYQVLPDGKVMALYRDFAELGEHIYRAVMAKHGYSKANDLIEAACALGGKPVPAIQFDEDEMPF